MELLTQFLWFLVLALIAVGAIQLATLVRLRQLRQTGVYPKKGQATMTDVYRLVEVNMPVWAMRCYREIHKCSLRRAKEAIEGIPNGMVSSAPKQTTN